MNPGIVIQDETWSALSTLLCKDIALVCFDITYQDSDCVKTWE